MIPAVAIQTAKAATRSTGPEATSTGPDFVAVLQVASEDVTPATANSVSQRIADITSPAADGGHAADGAVREASRADMACSVPGGADAAILCALVGQTSVEAVRGPLRQPAMDPACSLRRSQAPAEVAVQQPAGDGLQLTIAGECGELLTAANLREADAGRGSGSDAAAPEPSAAAVESPAARPGGGAELATCGARAPTEGVSRSSQPALASPVGTPQWGEEFAARVSWLMERGDQVASIRLSPEGLGPVEVRLAVREGEASVWFSAAQAETRAAIEQALPRLRAMLAGMGLSLADASVFEHAPPDPQRGFVQADARRAGSDGSAAEGRELLIRYGRRGLIDDYA